MNRPSVTIQLEIQPVDSSVRGRAVDPRGETHEFAGWMGLVAVLDALVRDNESKRGPSGTWP